MAFPVRHQRRGQLRGQLRVTQAAEPAAQVRQGLLQLLGESVEARRLAERILADARERGYRAMRLDTVEKLRPAIALYESLGFRRIPPYGYNPVETALYFEAEL